VKKVVILGGGVAGLAGLSAAYELIKRGFEFMSMKRSR
jgi:uncharacterized protein with NAD-binding domain and iron-sulfur cluster